MSDAYLSYRSLVNSADLDTPTLQQLIKTAQKFHDLSAAGKRSQALTLLAGKTVTPLFYEDSTRTRLSFEMAAMNLGARLLPFSITQSSLNKGESLEDTLETLIALGVDAVVLRHPQEGLPLTLEASFGDRLALLNAGDGKRDHPTQGLLDVLTLFQIAGQDFERLSTLRLGIVGDIKHSRVVTATLRFARQLGVSVYILAPDALAPEPETWQRWQEEFDVKRVDSLDDLWPHIDVVMALRLQKERLTTEESPETLSHLLQQIQIKATHLEASPHVQLMHPGPVNWGIELNADLIRHPRSFISTQVKNGVFIRMACLEWSLKPSLI